MTATNHAVTGAVIALVVQKPLLAIPLALLSHFVLDVIPHSEPRDFSNSLAKKIIFTDGVIAAILGVSLPLILNTTVSPLVIFACMTAAVVPDLIWGIRYLRIKDIDKVFTEPMSKFSRIHFNSQWSESIEGFYVEAGWLAFATYLLVSLSGL